MLHRTPDEQVIKLALARWQNAKGRPKLGVGFAGWSNTGRVGKNLAELDADVTAEALVDEQGLRVAPALREADVLVSGGQQLEGPIYDQLSCRLILRPYVGYNDINVPAASERGILVCNVPDAYSEEVAMQGLAFLMAANRQLFAYERETRHGRWRDRMGVPPLTIHNSRAQTVGVIGSAGSGGSPDARTGARLPRHRQRSLRQAGRRGRTRHPARHPGRGAGRRPITSSSTPSSGRRPTTC